MYTSGAAGVNRGPGTPGTSLEGVKAAFPWARC